MIAAYHGANDSLASLRTKFSISLKGMTLRSLMRCAESLGFRAQPLRVGLERLAGLSLPCVLHWQMNHFVVLKTVGKDYIVIHDPSAGLRRVPLREVDLHFTGVALELYPTGSAPAATADPGHYSIKQLIGPIRGVAGAVGTMAIITLALECLGLAMPLYTQWLFDVALPENNHSLIGSLALGFGLVALVHAVLTAMRSWSLSSIGVSFQYQWLANVFSHLLKLPYEWFAKRHLGEIVNKFGSIRSIQKALTVDVLRAAFDGLMALATLAFMFSYSASLTALSLALVAVYAGAKFLTFPLLRDAADEELTAFGKQNSSLIETARGIQAIRLADRLVERRTAWLYHVAQQFNAQLRHERANTGLKFVGDVLSGGGRVLIVYLIAINVASGEMSIGAMLAFLAFREQFAFRTIALIDQMVDLRLLRVYADRIADIVCARAEKADSTTIKQELDPSPGGCSIDLHAVSFAYSSHDNKILTRISMRVEAGECVAFAGPSGCGKTTLVKILLGLLHPTEGEVRIDGKTMEELGQHNYRSMVSAVMQDETLFAGTIADNISFFDPDVDSQWVTECARSAGIAEEVEAMPMQYRTLVGDLGSGLSGGQKQRVLLARALYRRPRLLILDEATSHLDLANEARINLALKRLQVTRIVIAHRPETIKVADRVVHIFDLQGSAERHLELVAN
jgi:ATP-binding cassette subfamily B protein RaxB